MSKQLTVGDILELVNELKASGMKLREIKRLPVYLGDDDELNGIHCAWYRQLVDTSNTEDAGYVEMINENGNNFEITDKAILIS